MTPTGPKVVEEVQVKPALKCLSQFAFCMPTLCTYLHSRLAASYTA